jgi:hypothetical protein
MIVFSSCRKGEDDPLISFRSRKARVAGNWKVTHLKNTFISYGLNNTYTTVYETDGSSYTNTISNSNPVSSQTTTGTVSKEYTFEKKGNYSVLETRDGIAITYSGVWNFTSGVGDVKNKSQITLYQQLSWESDSSSMSNTGNYFDKTYYLKELRNKKMVWYSQVTNTRDNVVAYTIEEEITLEAR